ncbi:DSBA-like thioredoxin domain protein [Pseudodesulfovibrio hydrargyri]|uniref:DSBA-like thioredoxin domain protein n=1 Tax=Pseudodesulfovibrio hydrargyri TaxID=2125990 RepID=A0A1J5MSV5_9BACT|nr:DsbA family oxidoreductase [Pseudodesulfovibrio hydrargyri]OIQ49693.1 DSBA-like thioredoxin domain protein [Pseudodesulfovibrio hydrargyri]
MPINVTIFSDFVCPFCFVGSGIIDRLRKDFDIRDTWLPHELHPETPPEGRPLDDLVDRFDLDQVIMTCNQRGEPYGIRFARAEMLFNSRLALEAAEFARDAGLYHDFHGRMFRAGFTEGRNIGDMEVILDVALRTGLDREPLKAALADHRYADRVADGSRKAKEAGVTALPTFIVEGQPRVTGAVDESVLRQALEAARRKV